MRQITLVLGLVFAGSAYAADRVSEFTLPSGASVRIVEASFEESKRTYTPVHPCLVDGQIPFGVDCERPREYVKQLTVVVHGKRHELDVSSMYDAWQGRALASKPVGANGSTVRYFGGHCVVDTSCVFRGAFSDGAGTFVAEWVVHDGVSQRTVLSNSRDVVGQVMRNIDGRQ